MKNLFLSILLIASTFAFAVPPRDPSVMDRSRQVNAVRRMAQETMTIGQRKTFPRVPVLLVEYQDIPFRLPAADIDSLFNAKYRPQGSVKTYFTTQSDSTYIPRFDIYGPVKVSKGTQSYAKNASSLVVEACQLMNDSIDFTIYDTDGNGVVDLVFVIYAGPPASDENYIDPTWLNPSDLIWPHYSHVSSSAKFDGKSLSDYEVSSELTGVYSNADTAVISDLGLACHEFGHGLGLPDLYSTDQNSVHKTLGEWDIMDYGCYSPLPANYTIYERWFMGWTTPRLINQAEDVTMRALTDGGEGLMITATGQSNLDGLSPNPKEFWLLENRQQTSWDQTIPGHGLVIYHINYDASTWSSNTINYSRTNMHFDLIEADGLAPDFSYADTTYAWFGKPGDAFPEGATSYTAIPNYPITNIAEADGVITFQFMGGITPTQIEQLKEPDMGPTKIFHNGMIYIRRENKLYTITGNETHIL